MTCDTEGPFLITYPRQILAHLHQESFNGCSQQHCLNSEILETTDAHQQRMSKKCGIYMLEFM